MPSRDLSAIVGRVLDYTIAMRIERVTWQKAPAISGVLAWDEPRSVAVVTRWIDRAVETQTSAGLLNYSDVEEYGAGHAATLTPTAGLSASLGFPLLQVYERTREARYLDAAHRQWQALVDAPRTSEGGIWSRHEAPELWIDWVYMICPFMAKYGLAAGNRDAIDEAFRQFEVHVRHLVDPHTGLARHAWRELPDSFPQSTLWARGNGWLVVGAAMLWDIAPDHPGTLAMTEVARRALMAMAERQDRSGYLRHILDDPRAKLESSATLMLAYALARAVAHGVLDKSWLDAALRGVRAVAGEVDADGAVGGVAVPPGGPGVPFGTTPFGQGFFLLAAHALRDELGITRPN